MSWLLGRALFTGPGEYRLMLRLDVDGWERIDPAATVLVRSD